MLSPKNVRKLQKMHLGVTTGAFYAQLEDAQFQTIHF